MLFRDNSRVILSGLMVLLHFVYDVTEFMALPLPARVLAAFILTQAIFHSSCRAMHIRTWRRRFLHLQGLDLLEFSTLFEQSNTVYVLLLPLVENQGRKSEDGIIFTGLFYSVEDFTSDPPLFQLIPDKMPDFASIACCSVETSAMPS